MILHEKRRKLHRKRTPYSSATVTTGDVQMNLDFFNKHAGTFEGNDNNNPSTVEAGGAIDTCCDGGMGESLKLKEETKRYIKRYYIKPQNIVCSNKSEIVEKLAEIGDEDCTIYSLVNLDDHDDIQKLTNDDIIYYYEDNVLYDKNHVQIFEYDLSPKHEENRKKFDADSASNKEFVKNYDDRITDVTGKDTDVIKTEALDESSNVIKTAALADGNTVECIVDKDGYWTVREFMPSGNIVYSKDYSSKDSALAALNRYIKKYGNTLGEEFSLDFPAPGAPRLARIMCESTELNCCICGEEIEGYGNNAEPYKKGRCCDACNIKFVIPARFNMEETDED